MKLRIFPILMLIFGLLFMMLGFLTPLSNIIFGGLGVVCIAISVVLYTFTQKREL